MSQGPEIFPIELDEFESGRPKSLRTHMITTGYQPNSADRAGTVAVSGEYGPAPSKGRPRKGDRQNSFSSRSSSRQSSPARGIIKFTTSKSRSSSSDRPLRGTVAVTPSVGQNSFPIRDAEPMHGSSGYARPIFSEAEQRIIDKGKEVAIKAAEIERAEYQIRLQQQATAQSWERTQQREDHSKRMLQETQQVQHELENVKAAVAAEVQIVQVQVAAEKDSIAQGQQAVEAERQRTVEIQAEVERQVALKQRELADKEIRLSQESRVLAEERTNLEQWSHQQKAKELALAQAEIERKAQESPAKSPAKSTAFFPN